MAERAVAEPADDERIEGLGSGVATFGLGSEKDALAPSAQSPTVSTGLADLYAKRDAPDSREAEAEHSTVHERRAPREVPSEVSQPAVSEGGNTPRRTGLYVAVAVLAVIALVVGFVVLR